ncbi:MAG: 1,4-dihydroxy-6-naphthoate synthase [Vulcanimicrobiaceae bacterium]
MKLAYSPCPNDTYIFAALTNGLIKDAPRVEAVLDDVETLNSAARRGRYELTKVSYGAIPFLLDRYRILRSGGALGRGCGPLLIARPDRNGNVPSLETMPSDALIAIPGVMTTAFLLLRLALRRTPQYAEMRFDKIVGAVATGEVDAGLIIHESRFTYPSQELRPIVDLGEWWEGESRTPIPLGAILARRDLDDAAARGVDGAIRRSLAFARKRDDAVMPYVRAHAAEMSDDVMRKHIALYVNEYSDDVGDAGLSAITALFERAATAGLIPAETKPQFVP